MAEPDKTASTTADAPAATPDYTGAVIESVTRNTAGQLVVRIKGRAEPVVDARVARCFPWSLPETYISIRDKDGHEIVLHKTLDELDPASREVVARELAERVFNPRIQKVLDYKSEFGVTSITAATDRGTVTFQIRSRDDIRVLSATRLLFRDADGNTYELADINALDPKSRKHLQEYF
ncbi:MAG: DUF1854 domain-containing protein [Phycisphaerae bacterium]